VAANPAGFASNVGDLAVCFAVFEDPDPDPALAGMMRTIIQGYRTSLPDWKSLLARFSQQLKQKLNARYGPL
jgi:hypothetical protein